MKPSEEHCKITFDRYLRRTSPTLQATWLPGDEPPDYYLEIDDVRFAVEVTFVMARWPLGKISLPIGAIHESFDLFVKRTETRARERGILRGTYVVSFTSPIENFRDFQDDIQAQLLAYVEATRELDTSPSDVVFERGRLSCSIAKYHTQADVIHTGGPVIGKWEGEAKVEICAMLQAAIADKIHKLRAIELPKILLLQDAYHFASELDFKDCRPSLSGLDSFHTIYVIQSDTPGFVLHSEMTAWQ